MPRARRAAPLLCAALTLGAFSLPAAARGADAAGAIAALNAQRAANGIPAGIVENPDWSAKCVAHANYLVANGGQLAHAEDPAKPGYSQDGDWAGTNSVLAISRWWDDGTNPFEHAPIHLMQTLTPTLEVTGAGSAGLIGCMTTWPGYTRPAPPAPTLLSYPGDGRVDVPPAETAAEMPFVPGDFAGLPQGTRTGPHLYALAWGAGRGRISAASLTGPAGPVAVRTVDNTTPELGGYLPSGGIVIPVSPLAARSTYTASVTFAGRRDQSAPETVVARTWSFQTAGQAPGASVEFESDGVTVRSQNPAGATVQVTRLPSRMSVFAGTLTPGAWHKLALAGGSYRACAHQDPSGPWDGFDACEQLDFRSYPRVRVSAGRARRGRVTLTVRADATLIGAKATILARAGRRHRTRSVKLKRTTTRVALRLPVTRGTVKLTLTARPAKSELKLADARAAKTIHAH